MTTTTQTTTVAVLGYGRFGAALSSLLLDAGVSVRALDTYANVPDALRAPNLEALVHGVDDDIVPVSQGRSYAATHSRARLVEIPDCGHFGVVDPLTDAWHAVVGAVRAAT